MRALVVVLALLVAYATAQTAVIGDRGSFSHGMGGSISAVGSIKFNTLGFYNKRTASWTRIPQPIASGGTIHGMTGTNDGGIIIVGSFTAIQSGSGGTTAGAYGIAFYNPTTGRWCAISNSNLYQQGNTDDSFPCGGGTTEGANFQTALQTTGGSPVYPLTTNNRFKVGPSGQVNAGYSASAEYPISAANGYGIARNGDVYYVFGNFNMVGDNQQAAHNSAFDVCGLVQITYNGSGAFTPARVGSGYKCYTATQTPNNLFYPRYCGISGTVNCSVDATQCNRNPHRTAAGNPLSGAVTLRWATGTLILVENKKIWRYNVTPTQSDIWTRLDAQDTSPATGAARDGSKIDWAGTVTYSPSGLPATSNFGTGPWRDWDISTDGNTVYLFGFANPLVAPVSTFPAGQQYQHSAKIAIQGTAWSTYTTWAETGQVVSQAQNADVTGCGVNGSSGATCIPAVSSNGIYNGVATNTTTSSMISFDARITERNWFTNRLANIQFTRINEFSGTAFGTTMPGADGPIWSQAGTANTGGTDQNGLPRRRYDIGLTRTDWLWRDTDGVVYAHFASTTSSGSDVYYGFSNPTTSEHTRYFNRRCVGNFAEFSQGAWTGSFLSQVRPFAAPTFIWQQDITRTVNGASVTDKNIYVYGSGYTQAYNFMAASGVAMYDQRGFRWIDPFANNRLGRYSNNRISTTSATAEQGQGGTVNVVHFSGNGQTIVVGGAFDFIGTSPYGSIVSWDGTNVRDIVSGQGLFVSTIGQNSAGPVTQNLGDQAIRVSSTGTVNCITEYQDRIYVGGTFNTNSADVAQTGVACLNNIAFATVGGTAWTNAWGGCDGTVRQLVQWGGRLYAAGSFTRCGLGSEGTGYMQNIASLEIGATTPKWEPLGEGVNSGVNALAVWRNGPTGAERLYVAGSFSTAGGNGMAGIAAWDGNLWFPVVGQCLKDCDATVTSILNAPNTAAASGFLGTIPVGTWNELIATPTILFAVSTSGQQGGVGNRALLLWDGLRWTRATRASTTLNSVSSYNGRLATNASANGGSGGIIVTEASSSISGTDAQVNNYNTYVTLGDPNVPGNWEIHPGFQGYDGSLNIMAGASSMVASVAMLLAMLCAAVLMM